MTADRGREAVYAAEEAAFGGTSYDSVVEFDELLWLRNALQSSSWWPEGQIVVERARTDAVSSTTRQGDDGQHRIRLAQLQCTPLTFAHEAAHVLAGVTFGHGPVFRRAEIDVVLAIFGSQPATWLSDSFASIGLDIAPRSWREPSAGPLQRVIDLA